MLCIVLLLVTRTFQYFPGMGLVQEAAILLAPIALLVVVARTHRYVGRTPWLEFYMASVMVVMPIWSGLAAWQVHGQPVIYGVLAWRGYALISVALGILYALRAGWFMVRDLERAFVICAWLTLGLYASMSLLLDPQEYIGYGIGFVEDRFLEGYRFKFSPVFAIFALFHYAARAVREHRPALYISAMIFGLFLFGTTGGRILTVSVLLTALVMLAYLGGWRQLLKGGSLLAAALALVIGLAALAAPDETAERLGKFADAFAVFGLDADAIDDVSAASRALQTLVALPQIEQTPLAGGGRISSQWVEEAFTGLLGAYFYPDDIGIIGMVYQFGIIGTMLIALQFAFACAYLRRGDAVPVGTMGDTFAAYLVFLFFSSLATGAFVMFAELSMLLVAVVAYQGTSDA